MHDKLSVKEIEEADIEPITSYWLQADKEYLQGMGVDMNKMPRRNLWQTMLSEQLAQPYEKKTSYCIIWQINHKSIGHSNVNKIIFGKEAYMHLHLWDAGVRKKGVGSTFIKMTLPYFFHNLQLQKLYCEPYALNPAPNKTLEKLGFEFVKTYTTIPGWLNFEQPVNLWELTQDRYKQLFEDKPD